MTNAGDPRNDRRTEDADYPGDDRLACGICDRPVTPANFGAWDRWDVFCVACSTAAEADCPAGLDSTPTDEAYHAPMTGVEALGMAVDSIMGARTLLNGGGAHPDDEDEEDETVEVNAPLSTEEAIADLKSRGAA